MSHFCLSVLTRLGHWYRTDKLKCYIQNDDILGLHLLRHLLSAYNVPNAGGGAVDKNTTRAHWPQRIPVWRGKPLAAWARRELLFPHLCPSGPLSGSDLLLIPWIPYQNPLREGSAFVKFPLRIICKTVRFDQISKGRVSPSFLFGQDLHFKF